MRTFVAVLALVAAVVADVSHLESQATIVSQEADVFPDQFQYKYETSNGISGQETGVLKKVGNEGEAIAVQGAHSYSAPDGTRVVITFTADENGYQPQGSHLPTPPPAEPIPDYISRALQYIAAHPPKPEPGSKF